MWEGSLSHGIRCKGGARDKEGDPRQWQVQDEEGEEGEGEGQKILS